MTNQNKKQEQEAKEYPEWSDIIIFPGSLAEFREVYGASSEIVRQPYGDQSIRGSYLVALPGGWTLDFHKFLINKKIPGKDLGKGGSLWSRLHELDADAIIRAHYLNHGEIDYLNPMGHMTIKKWLDNKFCQALFEYHSPTAYVDEKQKELLAGIKRGEIDLNTSTYKGKNISDLLRFNVGTFMVTGIPVRSEKMKRILETRD